MSSSDEEGPRPAKPVVANVKRRKRDLLEKADAQYVAGLLEQLPSCEMYERSWMHRETVTRIAILPRTDFVATASTDGVVKLWKHVKTKTVLEFVKTFLAHAQPIDALVGSPDGEHLASLSCAEKAIRFFQVRSFDMVSGLTLEFSPATCEWSSNDTLAISDSETPVVRILKMQSMEFINEFRPAAGPTVCMSFSPRLRAIVSVENTGIISYWAGADSKTDAPFTFPGSITNFTLKINTELFELAKLKVRPISVTFSPNGVWFNVVGMDGIVRVFDFSTGRIHFQTSLFESTGAENDLRKSAEEELREALKSSPGKIPATLPLLNSIFDESGRVLITSKTSGGIEMIDFKTRKVLRRIGGVEESERFCQLALFQGEISRDYQMDLALAKSLAEVEEQEESKSVLGDPIIIATAYNRDRFYLFSSREPSEDRDVFNEKPSAAQIARAKAAERAKRAIGLPRSVTVHTTLGDVRIRLFPQECPKTVENFIGHCKRGTYDSVIFHRVIRGFMVQTGDPEGDGTGGESIWGGNFEDEFHDSLKHDRPFTVSMANCGPNTNGSQFFITTAPQPHLDKKHTVFGRVESETSQETVKKIEVVKVDTRDRPLQDVKIVSVTVE